MFGCRSRRLRRLTKNECLEMFISMNVIVKYGVRVYLTHGEGKDFKILDDFHPQNYQVHLAADEITSLIQQLRITVIIERTKKSEQELFLNMTDEKLNFETGLNQTQFRKILNMLRNIEGIQNKKRALGVYLPRLRRGYTYAELGCRWGIVQQTASKWCEVIRKVLIEFANNTLDLSCSRQDHLRHRTDVSKILHSPSRDLVILILDGTYLFIEKSGNFAFQRQTYSGHKKHNLIKPMMAVCPDGFIAAVWGSYSGNKNDASIMTELLQQKVWGSFQDDDVLLVDRGFRDAMDDIKNAGFTGKMPAFPVIPSAALTVKQANASRLITKNRYIVEVINGWIKKYFKYFDNVIHNTTLTYLFEDVKIACLLHNFILQPVKLSPLDIEIANRMLSLSDEPNNLSILVEELNLNARRSIFERVDDARTTFPAFTTEDLAKYTCGTYQMKMAASYYQDHVNKDGDFKFEVSKETVDIDYAPLTFHYEKNIVFFSK